MPSAELDEKSILEKEQLASIPVKQATVDNLTGSLGDHVSSFRVPVCASIRIYVCMHGSGGEFLLFCSTLNVLTRTKANLAANSH